MSEYQSISRMDIESKFTSNSLKVSRTISLTMFVGAFLFFIINLYLNLITKKPEGLINSGTTLDIHIYTLLILGFIVYTVFIFAPKVFLSKKYLIKKLSNKMYDENKREITDPVIKLITIERIYMIIRLALLEGISLFAMVILFLAVSNGDIYSSSLLWLLVIPLIIQAVVTFKSYISKTNYIDRIVNDILSPVKGM